MKFSKNKLNLYYLCVLLVILMGCNLVSFELLNVTCNVDDKIDFFNDDFIILNFSILPVFQEVEDSIKLTNQTNNIVCDFVWNGSKCYIKPREKWNNGEKYSFTLSNLISMQDGRSYDVNINRTFYYGENDKYLKLINCSILDGNSIENNEIIVYTFNKSVDLLSFKNAFSISPTIPFKTEFSQDNKVVKIIPSENWKTNTLYTWEFSKIKSVDTYPQDKKYSGTFFAPVDVIQPEVVSIHPVIIDSTSTVWKKHKNLSDIFVNESIGFIFSESVDFDSVKNAITFVPSISGNFIQYDEDGKEFVYCIQKNWEAEKEYQVKIANSLVDKNGIPLYEEYTDFFEPKIDYIEIDSIKLNSTEITDYSEQTHICYLDEVQIEPEILVTVNFSKNIADKYKEQAFKSVSVSSFFPSSAISPTIISVSWIKDSQLEIRYKGFTKSTVAENFYKMIIQGDSDNILTDEGGYIKEDLCVYFKVL